MGDLTNDVLAERLNTANEALTRIEVRLAQLVSREVYDANREADRARIAMLEKRADDAEAERDRAFKEAAERQRTIMRWVIGAIAVPIIVLILNLYFSTHPGVKP